MQIPVPSTSSSLPGCEDNSLVICNVSDQLMTTHNKYSQIEQVRSGNVEWRPCNPASVLQYLISHVDVDYSGKVAQADRVVKHIHCKGWNSEWLLFPEPFRPLCTTTFNTYDVDQENQVSLRTAVIAQRVVFKVAGLVHQSLAGPAPAYLANDCHLLSDAGRRPLRSHSNDIRKLLVPRTHNKLCDRSLSAAGPRLWNDLPPGLRRPGLSFDSFRRSLKTHLFGNWSA